MNMTPCSVCGKIHASPDGGNICKACKDMLDKVFDKARRYLRDNPKLRPNPDELAEAIGEDKKIIEILVLEGRFNSDSDEPVESEDEKKRKALLASLEQNLAANPVQEKQKITTYGSDRHGNNA